MPQTENEDELLTALEAAEKLGVDPAVMANPLISTITDAVSLLIYFEIAKLMISF